MDSPLNEPLANFQVDAFREAAPYIHAHRHRTLVVSFAGEAIDAAGFPTLVHDIALLQSLGVRLVLVPGARPQIERRLDELRATPNYHQGLRITDDTALAAVKEAVGYVRHRIEALLSMGLVNTPMSGMRLRVVSGNFVTAQPLGVREGIDFAHTGEVRAIDAEAIHQQLDRHNIVLLSPLGYSPTGEAFNLSAADVATMTAIALRAHKLIFLLDTAGPQDAAHQPIRQLTLEQARQLKANDPAADSADGQQALASAIKACTQDVRRVHLISRHIDGALFRELYTRDGLGTLVTGETYEGLRQASIDDAGGILELIAPLEAEGIMVRRSREQLELEIDRFEVIERDGMIIACAALYAFPAERLGELACLAVHPDYRRQGRADTLLQAVIDQARQQGLARLFVLTTRTAHWFVERGFEQDELRGLPIERREFYNYARNAKVFIKALA